MILIISKHLACFTNGFKNLKHSSSHLSQSCSCQDDSVGLQITYSTNQVKVEERSHNWPEKPSYIKSRIESDSEKLFFLVLGQKTT